MIPFLGNKELWKVATAQVTQVGSMAQDGVWPGPPGSENAMKSSTGTGSGPQWGHLLEAVGGLDRRNEYLVVINVPSIIFTSKHLLGISG